MLNSFLALASTVEGIWGSSRPKKQFSEAKVDVSDDCRELIYSLCKTNPCERINWNDFFNHRWFKNDEI